MIDRDTTINFYPTAFYRRKVSYLDWMVVRLSPSLYSSDSETYYICYTLLFFIIDNT